MVPTRYGRQRILQSDRTAHVCRPAQRVREEVKGFNDCASKRAPQRACGYRIKPHGQLVPVSLTHYCASTPGLSTRWSSATLQGGPPLCALCAGFRPRARFPGGLCRVSPIQHRLGRQASRHAHAYARLPWLLCRASPILAIGSGDKHPGSRTPLRIKVASREVSSRGEFPA